jgi:hypothetical protein
MDYHTFINPRSESEEDLKNIVHLNRMFSAIILDLMIKINLYENRSIDESIIFKLCNDIDNYMMEIQFIEFKDSKNLGVKIRAIKNDYDKKKLN